MISAFFRNNRGVIQNSFYLILEKALFMIVSFFVGIYVARYLGPENFGELNFVYSIILVIAPLSNLGLKQIIVKFLANYPSNYRDKVLSSSFSLILITSIFLFLLYILITYSLLDTKDFYLHVILAAILLFQCANVIDAYYQYNLKSKYKVFAKSIAIILTSLLKIYFIYREFPIFYFALSYTIDYLLYTIFILGFYSQINNLQRLFNFDLKITKLMIGESWPLLFSGMLIILYMKMDKIMLGSMLGNFEVGIYAAASRLSETWYFVGTALSQSLFPKILKTKKDNILNYDNTFVRIYRLMFYLCVPVVIVVFFTSPTIINTLFGADYVQSSEVLRIHFLSSIFVFIGLIANKWLIAENLTRFNMYKSLISLIINIILNYVLIPKYGVQGAAWATLISQAVASYFIFATRKDTRKNFFLQSRSILLLKK
jgi:O-antigen/teichoic acid export membrane protein